MLRAPRLPSLWAILASTALLGCHGHPVAAGECFDYATSPHWISTTPILYPVVVATQGSYAYVSTFDSALVVVDVTDSSDPEIVARLELEHAGGDLEPAGDVLYLANDDGGLAVIDISTPTTPAVLTRIDTPGAAFQLSLADHYVYVADFSAGVQVIDVAVPAAPVIVATLAAPGFAYAVETRGTELLVGHGHGLMIADVSDPLQPYQLGNLPTHRIVGVGWMGDVACASAEEDGFLTIDVSAPQSPSILGHTTVPLGTWAGRVTINGTIALVSVAWAGLWAIDCTSPAAPKVALDFGLGNKIASCAVHENRLFAADFPGGLAILELGDQAPIPAGGTATRPRSGLSSLRVTDSHAYLLEGGWIDVFDLTNSGAPVLAASLPVSPWARTMAIDGGFAYLGLGSPGLARGRTWTPGGIEIVSITDLSRLDAMNKLPLPQAVSAITTGTGSVIHVLTTPAWPDPAPWLHCVDVSDPAAPHILGSIELPGGGWGAAYGLGRVYVYGTALQVVDTSNPTQPHLTGTLELGRPRQDMELVLPTAGEGGPPYAYLIGSSDLAVVDLSAPDAPMLAGSVPAIGQGNLARQGTALYAGLHGGFSVYDLTEPRVPILAGGAVDIDIGQLAVHPPTGELVIATAFALETHPPACTLLPIGGRGGETAGENAVNIVTLALAPAHPNPFRGGDPAVSLGYTLPNGSSVRLAIVDAAGRCVRRLVDASQEAGSWVVGWDGRNDRGASVASGVYFIRLESGGETRTERLLRLR